MSCTLLNSKPSHGAAIAPTTTVIGDTVYATNSAALCGRLAGEAVVITMPTTAFRFANALEHERRS